MVGVVGTDPVYHVLDLISSCFGLRTHLKHSQHHPLICTHAVLGQLMPDDAAHIALRPSQDLLGVLHVLRVMHVQAHVCARKCITLTTCVPCTALCKKLALGAGTGACAFGPLDTKVVLSIREMHRLM